MSEVERSEIGDAPPVRRRQLLGLLLLAGAPAAFFVALNIRYSLAGLSCTSAGARVALELGTLVGLLGAAGAAYVGWTWMSGNYDSIEHTAQEQRRFLGACGLMSGALFLLSSLALWLPSLFASPCGRP